MNELLESMGFYYSEYGDEWRHPEVSKLGFFFEDNQLTFIHEIDEYHGIKVNISLTQLPFLIMLLKQ